MTSTSLNTILLISGLVLLLISIVGQSKLLFLEINPGCWGRFLAFTLGVLSLIMFAILSVGTTQSLDAIATSLFDQIRLNLQNLTQFALPD
ncbi:hypothetical protein ACE1CI_16755 [Aerosakkonemataceae cyanobacterium BLCC-F50]|uniref:Uncharacterized protein n=1 Tax=Floridaenema flaviceps BLCC-F50 TaxID=3153642 RepID=A0ABV4XS75_9CYAN